MAGRGEWILEDDLTLEALKLIYGQLCEKFKSRTLRDLLSKDTYEHRQASFDEFRSFLEWRTNNIAQVAVPSKNINITRTAAINELLSVCKPRPYLQTLRRNSRKDKSYRVRWRLEIADKGDTSDEERRLDRCSSMLLENSERQNAIEDRRVKGPANTELSIAANLKDLIDARRCYDAVAAREMVKRLKEGEKIDLLPLRQTVAAMVSASDPRDRQLLLALDMQFHAHIAELAGLKDVARCIRDNRERLLTYRLGLLLSGRKPQQLIDEHREIIRAIESEDFAAVDRFVAHHLAEPPLPQNS